MRIATAVANGFSIVLLLSRTKVILLSVDTLVITCLEDIIMSNELINLAETVAAKHNIPVSVVLEIITSALTVHKNTTSEPYVWVNKYL